METAEDKTQFDGKSLDPVWCPHYGRNTCFILFKCCNTWYPCHKCHNEAILLQEKNAEEPDNRRPSIDHFEEDNTVSEEINVLEMAISSEPAETRFEAEGQQDFSAIGDEVEETVNVVGGTSDEQSSEDEAHDDENGFETGEENEPLVPMDVTPSPAAEIEARHSVAATSDGIRLNCKKCGREQECFHNSDTSFSGYFCGECKPSITEQESKGPCSLQDLEANNTMPKKIDDFEMESASETDETSSSIRGLQDSASGSREMDDTKNGVAGTEEASNTQAETDHNENSVERSEDDDSQSLVDSMSPSSEGQQDALTTGAEMKGSVNVVGGTSDEKSSQEYDAHDDEDSVETGEESESLVPMDVTPSSAAKMEARQSGAATLDGIRLNCKKCVQEQEYFQDSDTSFSGFFCGECNTPIEEQESNTPCSLENLEGNKTMPKEINDFEMASPSETEETSNGTIDLQDSASGSGEMDDTRNGVAETDVASNTQAETDHNENSVERSEEDDSQSLVDSMPPSAEGLDDASSSSGEVENTKNGAAGASDAARTKQLEAYNDENSVERSEEDDSQSLVDSTPLSTAGNKKTHSMATALDGIRLKCAKCYREQEISEKCEKCSELFARYFCPICKLLIEKDVDPYHCKHCGICRANDKDHFHCMVCQVCMSRSIKDSHICSDNRGHDPCAICLEELFSGAIAFSCLHIVHKECALRLFLRGSNVCPLCRSVVFQNGKDKTTTEGTSQQMPSNQWILNFARGLFSRSRQNATDHQEQPQNTQPFWQKLLAKFSCGSVFSRGNTRSTLERSLSNHDDDSDDNVD